MKIMGGVKLLLTAQALVIGLVVVFMLMGITVGETNDSELPTPEIGNNVALSKPAYASSSWQTTIPGQAFDGDKSNENTWNSGTFAPAWIYVDLQQNYNIAQIRLIVEQTPDGNTVHNIYTSQDASNWTLVRTLGEYTSNRQILTIDFVPHLSNVRYVKVETISSPSWIAWAEIEVYEAKSSSISITKSAYPYSIRQFKETTIKISIENSGTLDVKSVEVMDSIHPSFDLISGDFPNPKKYDNIRMGDSREIKYTIKSKESGVFTLDPVSITYTDDDGNIQEVKSKPVSIKVVQSSEGAAEGNYPSELESSAVLLHGEKTDVVLGEDVLLKLSAVNLINKPSMTVQVILYPPSGMSVTSSEFVKSGAGIFTTTYTLNPGDGKDIEVRIKSNQVGNFSVKGRIVYFFGDDKKSTEDHTLALPIKVRKEAGQTVPLHTSDSGATPVPGFGGDIAIVGTLFVSLLIKKRYL